MYRSTACIFVVTGVHVFVVGPTAYHMAYHGAEVMVRVLAPSMIAAARDKYDVKTINSMPPGELLISHNSGKHQSF